MPDFVQLTNAITDRKFVVVTSMIAAVSVAPRYTEILLQGVWIKVKESEDFVLHAMGVPPKQMIIDRRDRPIHELLDEELIAGWKQWCESKNIHSLGVAAMMEAELRRRQIVVGGPRE